MAFVAYFHSAVAILMKVTRLPLIIICNDAIKCKCLITDYMYQMLHDHIHAKIVSHHRDCRLQAEMTSVFMFLKWDVKSNGYYVGIEWL